MIIPKITSLPVINTNEQQNLTIVAANLSAQFTSGKIDATTAYGSKSISIVYSCHILGDLCC